VRADLARTRLRVVTAEDATRADAAESVQPAQLGARPEVLAAINGGYFDEAGKAIGWVVSEGRELSRLSPRGWGVLTVEASGAPAIVAAAAATEIHPREAIQAGPRLVVHGEVNSLKPQLAVRSFVGIDAEGRVVLGSTTPVPVTATGLAQFLAAPREDGGLGLVDALNLDGGSSSALYVRAGDPDGRDVVLGGAVRVPNALAITRR
jgi:uncharacterized protein YigE (DUF2233 family)